MIFISLLVSCVSPHTDAGAYVYAWEDTNCNGIPETGEHPLEDVCVTLAAGIDAPTPDIPPGGCDWEHGLTEGGLTNSEGYWSSGIVASTCNEIYVVVRSPDGFHPTTPTVKNGCGIQFGFAKESSCLLGYP